MCQAERRPLFDSQRMLRASVLALFACQLIHWSACATATDAPTAAQQVTQIIAHRGASAERPECTLAAIRRAIEVGATAVEVDVRTSRDGQLFILHDATLDRTTNGEGPASAQTLAQLQQLDAGSWFAATYRNQRIPSLIEVCQVCRGRIDLLLDLKEQGDDYDLKVANVIRDHGEPAKTIVGVRSVAQAERFRTLLPDSRQLALIPSVDSIEAFAAAGVDTIRLWPRWLEDGNQPCQRVRATGKRLHLNGTMGEMNETLELLAFAPDSLSSDHPARLKKTLENIARGDVPANRLATLVDLAAGTRLSASESHVGGLTFLNRDYRMQELPAELSGAPRYAFDGGDGDQVRLRFRQPAVVFAVFDYNDTGLWSFQQGRPATEFGWQLWRSEAYRGSSNAERNGMAHRASIWFREFKPGQELARLPKWWLCLAIVDLPTAREIKGFQAGLTFQDPPVERHYSHAAAVAQIRPLQIPEFATPEMIGRWQSDHRKRFVDRMLYRYEGKIAISAGPESPHATHRRREFQVTVDGQRLFRFFRLEPLQPRSAKPHATIVCFMGHGKVAQVLDDQDSYQHACAANFAKAGFLVYAMENIGMEPGPDTHHDLDQSLRLEGYGWYNLLFAHQRILLDHVFADPTVDARRVGATGVSTGGLLALTAAVIDPRIAAASVQGIFGSMRISFVQDRHRHCSCGAIPRLLPEFDLPELGLLVAPRPLHICNGQTDGFSPAEAKRCVELIAPIYKQAGGREPLVTVSEGGHAFAFEPALEFFADHLSLPDSNSRSE